MVGVDGKTRRWVFLHVFKPQQPTLNWLDPSFAAERANYGDTARNIVDRGIRVLRLNAAPFLGIDPDTNDAMAQTYVQPLSIDRTNELAHMSRDKDRGHRISARNMLACHVIRLTASG